MDDLRVPNNRMFNLKKILNSNIENFIKYYTNEDNSDDEEEGEEGANEEPLDTCCK